MDVPGGPTDTRTVLDDVDRLRRRVRRERRPDARWAALVAAVAAVGAVAFVASDQIRSQSCEVTGTGMTVCATGGRGSQAGWVWLAATVLAVAAHWAVRYRRGTWRPTTGVWVAIVFTVLFVLPAPMPLLAVLPAVVYPVAAAAALGSVALRRRDPFVATAAAVVAVSALWIDLTVDAPALLHRNLGLALASVAVALLSLGAARTWQRQDRPA